MENNKAKIIKKFQKGISLKKYTTFLIGGPARYFYLAKTKADFIEAIKSAKELQLPFFILGGGSNLLVSDKGFLGLVIKTLFLKFSIQRDEIYAESGIPLSLIVQKVKGKKLGNLGHLAGIPGTLGGAIYGNAGTKKLSMKNIIERVEVFDLKGNKLKIFRNKDCHFTYRESIFKKKKNLIILSAVLKLKKEKSNKIEKDFKKHLNYRKNTQPLNLPSAGSIFKSYQGKILKKNLLKEFPELKEFNKNKMIPAGYLIEKCNLKGKKSGGARISEKHANFIVNLGKAKAKDVVFLIKL
ncbi:MAG TPA: UDP-N-acetylmuramate dehydrogenase, partial [Candidatus Parcubacteria bacterium]|nr:UDP-N-acetylmuramate dehydrogenase [Candidatus Parcubacteria bacterium]